MFPASASSFRGEGQLANLLRRGATRADGERRPSGNEGVHLTSLSGAGRGRRSWVAPSPHTCQGLLELALRCSARPENRDAWRYARCWDEKGHIVLKPSQYNRDDSAWREGGRRRVSAINCTTVRLRLTHSRCRVPGPGRRGWADQSEDRCCGVPPLRLNDTGGALAQCLEKAATLERRS